MPLNARQSMVLSWYAARHPESVVARMGGALSSPDPAPTPQVTQAAVPQAQPQVKRPPQQANATGGARAVQLAGKYTGVRERSGPNRGPTVDKIQRQFGLQGQAWCGAFAGAMANAGGARIGRRVVYVPHIMQDARNRSNGFSGWSTNSRAARPGDLVVVNGGGHVELVDRVLPNGDVRTIGGNTSAPGGGEGVARKVRPRGTVVGIAHVNYR